MARVVATLAVCLASSALAWRSAMAWSVAMRASSSALRASASFCADWARVSAVLLTMSRCWLQGPLTKSAAGFKNLIAADNDSDVATTLLLRDNILIAGNSLLHLQDHVQLKASNNVFLSLGDGAYLDGYWQSERYFAEVAQVARAEFALRRPPDAENQRMLDAIRGAEAVGIHARRGDYVTDARTRDVHGHAPAEYYAAAVARIRSLVRAPAFFVFSDDPAWAAQHLRVDPATVIVGHNDAGRDYEDLRLMSACRHHIIANSTFSWWAAWLGERPGQRVIAPRHWFRDGPDARDLVPARWERR